MFDSTRIILKSALSPTSGNIRKNPRHKEKVSIYHISQPIRGEGNDL